MSEVIIIGLDIAKYVFHVHGADERGRVILAGGLIEESCWISSSAAELHGSAGGMLWSASPAPSATSLAMKFG